MDVRQGLEIAGERYGFKLVVSDSGGILNSILLEQGLVDEISLVLTRKLLGKRDEPFQGIEKSGFNWSFQRNEIVEKKYVHLVYRF